MRTNEMNEKVSDAELRRDVLTIRFKKCEHQAVSDEAWRNRKSMSGWLREVALSKLADSGIKMV